jgi:16S rRNA C1402 N4-methylase RsmH
MRNATSEEIENYKSKRMATIEQRKVEEEERKRIAEEIKRAEEEAEIERMRWING